MGFHRALPVRRRNKSSMLLFDAGGKAVAIDGGARIA
jgi:hypothetical protein